jgi:O-antigen ligase
MNNKQQYLGVHWLGFLAIILAVSAPWFDLAVSNHSFVKTYIGGIGIAILVLVTLFKQYKNYEVTYHISYLKLFLGIVFALGVLSIFWSTNPDFSITKLLIWVTALMAFYVAYKMDITEDNLRKLSFYLIWAGGSIAIIGVLQYLFDPFTLTQAATPSSTFGNRNMATQPISMIFPLVAFVILNKHSSTKVMWIAGILGALMLTFNFYTSTRASWIAILVEVVLMSSLLIIKRKSFNTFASWNRQKTIIVITSLLIFFTLINFSEDGFAPMWEKAAANYERLASDVQNDKSLRYQIWTVAQQMITNAPFFGTGLGTWFHNLVNEGYSTYVINYVQRVHNDLIELAVEIGLIGVGVFLLAVIAIVWSIWAIILKAETKYLLFYFALFESLTGSFANLQFSFPYQLAMPALIFGIWMGLIAKKSEEYIKPIAVITPNFKKQQAKLYKQIVVGVNIVIFVVLTSIYASWMNMYSTLNKINLTRSFEKLERTVDTPIYHLEIQNIMNFLTTAYLKSGGYDIALQIIQPMLKYWPNDYVTLSRYAFALQQKGQLNTAIQIAERGKKVAPQNSHFINSLLFGLYLQTKQYDKYIALFDELKDLPEEYMADNPQMYPALVANGLRLTTLLPHIPKIYEANKKYNKYNCSLESNILYYYVLTNNMQKLKTAFAQEKNNPSNCITPNVERQVRVKLKL